MFNKQNVICRSIIFDRITTYLLEEYFNELSRLKQMKLNLFTHPVIGYLVKDTTLNIVFPETLSLYELLHSAEKNDVRKQTLDKREK